MNLHSRIDRRCMDKVVTSPELFECCLGKPLGEILLILPSPKNFSEYFSLDDLINDVFNLLINVISAEGARISPELVLPFSIYRINSIGVKISWPQASISV